MKMILERFTKSKYIFLVIFFSILSVYSLFHSGFYPTHDGEYHIIRFYEFYKSLEEGNIYPRWAADLNNGFGVPLFNFVYPLPNYVASLLHVFKVSFIDSFKINMIFSSIIGGIFFYLWSKEFWGKLGGLVSSIFYSFSPYHLLDVYIRGSVGEVWAMAFFPAFLYAYTKFIFLRKIKYLALSSIFLSLIIFSHNILALMFFVFVLLYFLLFLFTEKNKIDFTIKTFYIIVLGLGLSSIFWVPAILETKYAVGLQIFNTASGFPDLYQLLIPSWGSGFSGGDMNNQMSFQIGLANLMAVFIGLIVSIFQIINKNKKSIYSIFFISCFIFLIFLMLNISSFIWNTLPLMNYFQFPWRLLSLEVLIASFLAGNAFSLSLKNKFLKYFLFLFLIFISVSLGVGYATPAHYFARDDSYYLTKSNFIDGTNSIGNSFNTIFMKSIPKKKENKIVFLKGTGEIISNKEKSNYYSFIINTKDQAVIKVNLAYFPGWEVYVNNKKVRVSSANDGRFTFKLNTKTNNIKIIFSDTLIRKVSSVTSFISFFIIMILLINRRFATIKK